MAIIWVKLGLGWEREEERLALDFFVIGVCHLIYCVLDMVRHTHSMIHRQIKMKDETSSLYHNYHKKIDPGPLASYRSITPMEQQVRDYGRVG